MKANELIERIDYLKEKGYFVASKRIPYTESSISIFEACVPIVLVYETPNGVQIATIKAVDAYYRIIPQDNQVFLIADKTGEGKWNQIELEQKKGIFALEDLLKTIKD